MSIRTRMVTGFGVLLAAALTLFGYLFWLTTNRWLEPDALEMAKDKTIRLGRWISPTNVSHDSTLFEIIRNEKQGYQWALMDASGHLIQNSRFLAEFFPLPPSAREVTETFRDAHAEIVRGTNGGRFAVAWYPVFYIANSFGKVTGWTEAVVPLEPFEHRHSELRGWLLSAGLITLAGFFALGWHLSGLWVKSLREAAETAAAASASDLSRLRLAVPKSDAEVALLALSFNGLLDRLRDAHAHQEQFVGDASHELRTPLTALRAEIEIALRREREPTEYRRVLQACREELLRLSRLVEGLLALARTDQDGKPPVHDLVNVGDICREVCDQLLPLAAARSVSLKLDLPADLLVRGDADKLSRVVRNLVENALQHTPSEDHVQIRARARGSRVEIEVEDEGCGIAPDELSRIFDRFYRVEYSRSRAHGGAGLGLSMVKALTEAHGGTVCVRSEVGKGSVFTVSLPPARAALARNDTETGRPASH